MAPGPPLPFLLLPSLPSPLPSPSPSLSISFLIPDMRVSFFSEDQLLLAHQLVKNLKMPSQTPKARLQIHVSYSAIFLFGVIFLFYHYLATVYRMTSNAGKKQQSDGPSSFPQSGTPQSRAS